MKKLNLKKVNSYVEAHISEFHEKRIQTVDKLVLTQVLKRKNPYLFRAKNLSTAADLVKSLMDAHISSNEETIFGDWLEGLAIFINQEVFQGRKSGISGIDLEFDDQGVRYLVTIKSGPNWGNSSQLKKMQVDFKTAQKILRTSHAQIRTVAVNGCCYGRDNTPDKGDYFKYCGQKFWAFISGQENLYLELIEPLGFRAKARNDQFWLAYDKRMNLFTHEFVEHYCTADGAVDWEKIVRLNSGNE